MIVQVDGRIGSLSNGLFGIGLTVINALLLRRVCIFGRHDCDGGSNLPDHWAMQSRCSKTIGQMRVNAESEANVKIAKLKCAATVAVRLNFTSRM